MFVHVIEEPVTIHDLTPSMYVTSVRVGMHKHTTSFRTSGQQMAHSA